MGTLILIRYLLDPRWVLVARNDYSMRKRKYKYSISNNIVYISKPYRSGHVHYIFNLKKELNK